MLRNSLKSRRPKKTLPRLKRYRDARLKFVRQHKKKENSFWERVLRTDENKIGLFGHNYRNHVWRKDGEAYQKTRYQLSNLAVAYNDFGMFSAKGVGKISAIDCKMIAQK